MAAVRHVGDDERRARLALRHALVPETRAGGAEDAARAVVVLHGTEPPSVHLACRARVADLTPADVEGALYEDRSLVKQLAMRRTLFGFPRDLLPAGWGASSRLVAQHRARLEREVERHGVAADGAAWLATAGAAVLACLSDGRARTTREVREQVPEAAATYEQGTGTTWQSRVQLAPHVLAQLSLEARVARGRNDGDWRTSRPTWTTTRAWLGTDAVPLDQRAAYAELVRRWLRSYGPGTVEDLRWWLGTTKGIVRTALADAGAVEVSLDAAAGPGWLLPDDVEPVAYGGGPWVALLPVLDPSVMGWLERGFYLGRHAPRLFDRAGNAGTTAWLDGRVVGAWVQDGTQTVRLRLLEDVGRAARTALEAEGERLTGWLDGERVFTVYPSPVMRD